MAMQVGMPWVASLVELLGQFLLELRCLLGLLCMELLHSRVDVSQPQDHEGILE
jgi:hypothetical protein